MSFTFTTSYGTVMNIRKTIFDMKLDPFRFFCVTATCAVLLTCNLTRAKVDESHRSPVVQTDSGAVVGKVENLPHGKSVHEYLGIPYAEPPVGKLRFVAPTPVKPWSGIKNATEFGASCVQLESLPFLGIEKTHSGMSLYRLCKRLSKSCEVKTPIKVTKGLMWGIARIEICRNS